MDQQVALGRAIAEQRRRHGLSQAELARLLDWPAGWVSLVERGLVQAEPLPVVEAVASALGTPLPARHGSGARPAGPASRARERGGNAASALRLVLWDGGQPRSGPGDCPGPTGLRAGADRSWALTRAGRYGELADLLGSLLPELNAALRAAAGPQERAGLNELIAACYQACSAALAKLGEHESAKTAASRALSAAQRAGDLPLAAAGAYLLTRILMEMGRYPYAEETARKAIAALGPLAADGRPEAISLQGALTLLRALIAARADDPAAADEQLSWARNIAVRLTATGGCRDAGFGAAYVALYEIAVSLEASTAPEPASGRPRGPRAA